MANIVPNLRLAGISHRMVAQEVFATKTEFDRMMGMWTRGTDRGCKFLGFLLQELETDRAAGRLGEVRMVEPDATQSAEKNVGHRSEP